jgi:hypothetical protein
MEIALDRISGGRMADSQSLCSSLYVGTVSFTLINNDGRSSDLEMRIIGRSFDANSDWQGRWVITGGTGALEGLRGYGAWWGYGLNPTKPEECGVIHYSVDGMDKDDDD